jgi:uncharacterized RDD family membrane protein YckC
LERVTEPVTEPVIETASWPRRTAALFVDWVACNLVVVAVIGPRNWSDDRYTGVYTMGVFLLETTLLTALVGGSFGKLVTRVRVVRHDDPSRPVSLLRALVRTVLTFLLIPPLLTFDGRGLHDLAAGTRTVTV